ERPPGRAVEGACVGISGGTADAAIVGGFDSLLHPTSLFALNEGGMLSGDAAPFGQIVPAEGAAFFILERRSDALDRGADIFAEILGIECSLDPARSEQNSARGIRRLLRRLPDACQSFDFAVSSGNTAADGVAGAL